MSIVWIIKNFIATLLLPPANGLLLLLLAAILRRRRFAFGLAAFAVVALYVQSLGPVSEMLVAPLERRAGAPLSDPHGAQAIVVLGGGRDLDAPEYGGDTASMLTLVRLRYAATLARRHALPLLVTGGTAGFGTRSEAAVMAEILQKEFGVAVRWREEGSADSADNAAMSAALLRPARVRQIVLVTHAFHMPRARRAFERQGLEVVPAPTGYFAAGTGVTAPTDLLPQASALRVSAWALHEWIGIGWYELVVAWRAAGDAVAGSLH